MTEERDFRISANSLLTKSEGYIYNEIDDEIVILNVNKGTYYNLSKVGSDIWILLEKPHTFIQIVNYLTSKYAVELDRCINETSEYLEHLLKDGLIKIKNEETGV